MKSSIKTLFLTSMILLIFIGCLDKNKNNEEITINYIGYSVYLKMNPNADAELPPLYNLHFKIKNVSNETKVFIARGHSFDDTMSELFLTDTIQKTKIPLYTGNIHIMKPNKEYDIYANIDIRDFEGYFKLSDSFFNKKIDFSNDKVMLEKLLINMLNSSKIQYKQDTSDVYQYKLFDKEVQKIKNKNLIVINKPQYIK